MEESYGLELYGGSVRELTTALKDLVNREVTELPDGVAKRLRFVGVLVTEISTGREVELSGPVELSRYGSVTMTFTDRASGFEKSVQGITFIVIEEDGSPVRKPLNVVSRRLIDALRGDLASGAYTSTRYTIMASEPAPKTKYSVTREPIPPALGTV